MKKILTSLVIGAGLCLGQAIAQCPYNNFFWTDLTPTGPGLTDTEFDGYGGDRYTVTVVAGQTYIFSTCNSSIFGFDTQLTLYDNTGTTVLAYSDDDPSCSPMSQITWIATYSGVVQLLLDEFNCSNTGGGGLSPTQVDVTWVNVTPTCTGLPLTPICTQVGLNFIAGATGTEGTVTDPYNYWDCLTFAPDPTFYYLEISQAGTINMTLTGLQDDVDFIIWGPFANLTAAENYCGIWGNGGVLGGSGQVVDCSFDASNVEFPNINNAQVGEVYVMVITNYWASQVGGGPQNVTLVQTGGTGATDCSIVCAADAGTVTSTLNGTPTASPLLMCANGCVALTSNNDYVLPTPAAGEGSELMYAIYDCAPTTGNPSTDPCWTGYYWTGQDFNDCNNASSALLPLGFGNHFWIAPITADDGDDVNPLTIGHDNNGDGCFDQGTAIEIYYLTPITSASVQTCGPNQVVMTLAGGYPSLSGTALYTATDVGAGNMTQSGAQGQTLTFTSLNNGDVISVNVSSGGCSFNFQFTVNCTSCAADPGQW